MKRIVIIIISIFTCLLISGCVTEPVLSQQAINKKFRIVYSEYMVRGMDCIYTDSKYVGFAHSLSNLSITIANDFANRNFPINSTILIEEGNRGQYDRLIKASVWILKPQTVSKNEPPSLPNNNSTISSGTGFIIGDRGYVLTNYHVIEGFKKISMQINREKYILDLISFDKHLDVALLKINGNFVKNGLKIDTSQISIGSKVYTIGFPNPDIQGIEPKYTSGEINSLSGIGDDQNYIQISVPLQPGNSGGPLISENGNVVGIVSMRLSDEKVYSVTGTLPQNVNYAIKISRILPLLFENNIFDNSVKPNGNNVSIENNLKLVGIIIATK